MMLSADNTPGNVRGVISIHHGLRAAWLLISTSAGEEKIASVPEVSCRAGAGSPRVSCSPRLASLWLQVLHIKARKISARGKNYCHNLLERGRRGREGTGIVLYMDTVLTYVTVLCLLNASAFQRCARKAHIVFELNSSVIF